MNVPIVLPSGQRVPSGFPPRATALLESAAHGLSRRFQAPAVDVVDPAVVAAANAALERDPELDRRAAMRAVQVQHADAPAAIAKHHQLLAEDPRSQRRRGEIAREGDRLPEPP